MRENRTHGSEGGDGESRFRPLSEGITKAFCLKILDARLRGHDELAHPGEQKTRTNWSVDEKPTPVRCRSGDSNRTDVPDTQAIVAAGLTT